MPRGGTITIETAHATVDERFAAQHPGCCSRELVCISVSDTGVGMDDATLARMFDPFFTTKAPELGTGLGLATVFGVVKQHGGAIEAKSAPGVGTTVSVFLPAGVATAVREAAKPAAAVGAGETILVVEDQPMLRRMVVKMLSALGYDALEAPDGAAALEIVRRSGATLDLIVADVVMPGLGGEELFDAARSLHPRLPFIFTSANPQNRIREAVLAAGGVGWIEKPFDMATLGAKVRSLLGCGSD
jgi:CheY-like chemotaxis protein